MAFTGTCTFLQVISGIVEVTVDVVDTPKPDDVDVEIGFVVEVVVEEDELAAVELPCCVELLRTTSFQPFSLRFDGRGVQPNHLFCYVAQVFSYLHYWEGGTLWFQHTCNAGSWTLWITWKNSSISTSMSYISSRIASSLSPVATAATGPACEAVAALAALANCLRVSVSIEAGYIRSGSGDAAVASAVSIKSEQAIFVASLPTSFEFEPMAC
uniref:Uncharacterized protein n=1 Tax=Glossina austeni TaxID=7395 RepID=A0A1A9UZ11_GLOAU